MLDKYLLIKMYWNRSMSHIGLPLAIFEKVALLVILLKMFNIYNIWIMIISIFIMTVGMVMIGYLDVKYGIYKKETKLNNKHNPELMKLVRRRR